MIVIRFMGGLGNQMFQYSLYKKFMYEGKDVCADLSYYKDEKAMPFMLLKVFPQIKLKIISDEFYVEKMTMRHKKRTFGIKVVQKLFPMLRYIESDMDDNQYKPYYLMRNNCIFAGYWQSERYWYSIKKEILNDFQFNIVDSEKVKTLAEKIANSESASLHIRRGDYLEENNVKVFGNICTLQYYKSAVEYLLEKNNKIKFYVFSNDIEWIKDNLKIENAVYVSDILDDDTPDWNEMYLMSLCKYNVIANSTFSWWGAYLNKNKEKIVIAPSKWSNIKENKNICPKEWIRLAGK